MHPDTRPYLYLVGTPDLRDELTEEHVNRLRASRIEQDWYDQAEEARAGRRASRVVVAVIFAAMIVACALGVVIGHFAVKALANAAATVVQAEQFNGEW